MTDAVTPEIVKKIWKEVTSDEQYNQAVFRNPMNTPCHILVNDRVGKAIELTWKYAMKEMAEKINLYRKYLARIQLRDPAYSLEGLYSIFNEDIGALFSQDETARTSSRRDSTCQNQVICNALKSASNKRDGSLDNRPQAKDSAHPELENPNDALSPEKNKPADIHCPNCGNNLTQLEGEHKIAVQDRETSSSALTKDSFEPRPDIISNTAAYNLNCKCGHLKSAHYPNGCINALCDCKEYFRVKK